MIGRLLSAFARSRRHLEHDKSGGALIKTGPDGPETPLPGYPDERTSPDRSGWFQLGRAEDGRGSLGHSPTLRFPSHGDEIVEGSRVRSRLGGAGRDLSIFAQLLREKQVADRVEGENP
jgi:hypothetical protein